MIEHNIKNAPDLQEIENIKLNKIERFRLDNGIPLYLINAGEQEVLKIEMIFPAGRWQEPKKLVAAFTAKLLKEGTQLHSSEAISDRIDFLGASIKVASAADYGTIIIHTLSKYLEDVLTIAKELLLDAVFPEDEIELQKKIMIQKLKVDSERIEFRAQKIFMEKIFGDDHPYGYFDSIEDIRKINQKDLLDFFKNNYISNNAAIIVSGKAIKDTDKIINKFFGSGLRQNNNYNHTFFDMAPAAEKVFFDNKSSASQAAIRIGMPTITRSHPDHPAFRILNIVLGGYFGSRLMSNIREDKGYTYGIYSGLHSYLHSGIFYIGSEVGSDVCIASTKEIYYEVNRLKEELIPDSEMELVRNYILGTILNSIDGAFNTASILKNLITSGQDEANFYNFIETVKSITPQRLQQIAEKYFVSDNFYEVISGCKG